MSSFWVVVKAVPEQQLYSKHLKVIDGITLLQAEAAVAEVPSAMSTLTLLGCLVCRNDESVHARGEWVEPGMTGLP